MALQYMALQPRFGRAKFVQSWAPRLSLFKPFALLDFSHPWFRLPSGMALNSALCGRCLVPLIMCLGYRNLLLFTTPMAFRLLNSLSSSKLYLHLHTPFTTFELYIVRRTLLSKTSNRFFSLFVSTCFTATQHDQADQCLVDC
jgi:hypothetical protein